MVLCSDYGLLACDTLQSTIVKVSSGWRDKSSTQSSSIYSNHIVTCVTLDMSHSVYNPYWDSKNSVYTNKTKYNTM